jgi:tetratricopeptide (TPR) repeat protein
MRQKIKTMTNITKDNKYNSRSNYINYVQLFIVVAILMITPFSRGLYFRENYIPTAAFIGIAFILMLIKLIKEKTNIIESYADIAFLGLTLAYFISFIFGISKSNALDGVIKYLAAFMVYKISYELSKDIKIKGYLLGGIVLSGFVIALFSLLGSGGIVKINYVFGWGERLNGLYQYPNATASVLCGIFLLNIFMLMENKKRLFRVAYFVSASTLMLTFLETRSRGAMLTMIAAWVLAFLLSEANDKLSLISYSGASAMMGLLFYSRIYSAFIEQNNFAVLLIAFLTFSVVLGFIMELLVKQIQRIEVKSINRVIIGIIAVFALVGVAAFSLTTPLELTAKQPQRGYEVYQVKPSTNYIMEFEAEHTGTGDANLSVVIKSVDRAKVRTSLYNNIFTVGSDNVNSIEFTTNDSTSFITVDFISQSPETGLRVNECVIKDANSGTVLEELKLNYRLIPNDIAKKVNEISLKTESSWERLVFIKDGLKMFNDYFLTGTGSKGWGLLYTKYQSYGYVSMEPHNYYLQTAIESGLLGIISLVALLVCLVIAGTKLYIRKHENPYYLVGLMSMLFELFAHAFLDFDFSLFSMFLVLTASMGWLSSAAAQSGVLVVKANKGKSLLNYFVLTISIILVIVSTTMYSGILNGAKGASLIKTDTQKAKEQYESAIRKNYYNSAHLMDYGQILAIETRDSKDKATVERIYKYYKEVEKNDPYEVKYYRVMIKFYSKYGYFNDASALAHKLIEVQPLKPESYELKADLNYQLMNYYLTKKNYKEALNCNDNILETEKQHEEANKRTIAPFEITKETKEIISKSKAIRGSIESNIK